MTIHYPIKRSPEGLASLEIDFELNFDNIKKCSLKSETNFRCQCIKCNCWNSPLEFNITEPDDLQYYTIYKTNLCITCIEHHTDNRYVKN